ncbi:MAG: SRPBCC family protein [Acidimicrobiales bacterium]
MTDPVTASVRVAAPPHVVFPYFTDPALAVKWIADAASLDPRPGGTFSLDVRGNPARGEFMEVDPPRRVVFSWGIEGRGDFPPGSSTVEVVFQPDGDDTIVSLTHRDLPTEDHRSSHRRGWGEFLGLLGEVAGSAG